MGNLTKNVDAKRLVIEIITNICWYRSHLINRLLVPCGMPYNDAKDCLYKADPITGKRISKRSAAPNILDRMIEMGDGDEFIKKLIEAAAKWDDFHLHEREMEARATVERAKSFLTQMNLIIYEYEQKQQLAQKQQAAESKKNIQDSLAREKNLLRLQFESLHNEEDHQKRGLLLEDFLNRYFHFFSIETRPAFRRNSGGEQIDGGFIMDGWHYLTECKWKNNKCQMSELDSLGGKVRRSGKATLGMFISINGWSEHVPNLLKQNSVKDIILCDGYDIWLPLHSSISFKEVLARKIEHLNFNTEPFLPAKMIV